MRLCAMVKIPGKRFQAPEKDKATKIKRDRNASRVVNKARLKTGCRPVMLRCILRRA